MEGESASAIIDKLINIIMFLFTGISVFLSSVMTGSDYEIVLRNTIVALIISAVILFMIKDAKSRGSAGFSFDNYSKKYRFVIAYFVMTIISCVISGVSPLFWPYMSFFVILSLLSSPEIGMASGICFTMISVMLSEALGYDTFFMYVLAGVTAVALFRDIKEDTAIGYCIFTALLIQSVLIVAFEVLFQNRTFSLDMLILPCINLLLNLLIMLIFLNMFGVYILRKNSDIYSAINDTDYPLLDVLKDKDNDEYLRAIHTGYLSEKVSKELSLNDRAAKTCAYYYRIGKAEKKQSWNEILPYYVKNNFPKESVELIRQYVYPEKDEIRSKEAMVVYMCQIVVTSIMFAAKKDKNSKIDYDKLIDKLFDRAENEEKPMLYDITYKEYSLIREILKKEKQYYDFICGK